MNWHFITSMEDWEKAVQRSFEIPVAVFKHSTRCSVSSMAKRYFENGWNTELQQAEPYFLDLIAHRGISNRIAADTGVYHESPQLILLKEGKAIYHASHNEINPEALLRFTA